MEPSVFCVIPARGGSKGLPRKNVLPLGGKPLIAWSIEAARSCPLVQTIMISTDDQEIAEIARRYEADVPFLRPAELATDTASTEDVLKHAVRWYEGQGQRFDILVYLQTTDPFRRRGIVHDVVQALLDDPHLDSVFAAKPEHKNYWIQEGDTFRFLGRHSYLPRQQKPPVYREDTGIALATRTNIIKDGQRLGKHVRIIPHECLGDFIDIHTEADLRLANLLIEHFKVIPNEYE